MSAVWCMPGGCVEPAALCVPEPVRLLFVLLVVVLPVVTGESRSPGWSRVRVESESAESESAVAAVAVALDWPVTELFASLSLSLGLILL